MLIKKTMIISINDYQSSVQSIKCEDGGQKLNFKRLMRLVAMPWRLKAWTQKNTEQTGPSSVCISSRVFVYSTFHLLQSGKLRLYLQFVRPSFQESGKIWSSEAVWILSPLTVSPNFLWQNRTFYGANRVQHAPAMSSRAKLLWAYSVFDLAWSSMIRPEQSDSNWQQLTATRTLGSSACFGTDDFAQWKGSFCSWALIWLK